MKLNNLFIKEIRLDRQSVPDFDSYPFNIPVINNMRSVKLHKPVTFLVGENGSGKSTILEALAVSFGLSAEGGSRNMTYETYNTTSELAQYLKFVKSGLNPQWKYFLRAESFYTMATAWEEYNKRSGCSGERHNVSHGESFLNILTDLSENGLYFMDEPESALSPKNQMRLLSILHRQAQSNSQFIIATHSPILLSYIDAEILNVDDKLKPIAYEDTDIYQIYRRFLECPEKMQKMLFDS